MTEKTSRQRAIEEQLKEARAKLLDPPTGIDELLPLLDHVENLLSKVEQSPAKSTQEAISSLTSAFGLDILFRHPNADVKVAVASCISEITRITAPEAPYDDDKMKEVFQLIVSAFEDLSDKSSRSYSKRVGILETVANVRSCVVMLDLECDALIVEMFKLFLATIRDYHSKNIFSSMETIMVLVIEESEDITSELLTPLLACLKKNQEGSVAGKLAEKVFERCADKLKPHLSEAIKSWKDYTEVVTAVCKAPTASVVNTYEIASNYLNVQKRFGEADENVSDENVSGSPNSMDADENVSEPPNSMDADENVSEPPNSVVGDNGKENPGIAAKVEASACASEKSDQDNKLSADKLASQSEDGKSETQKPLMVESKLRGADVIRGGKPNSSMDASEDSDASHFDGEKEVENQLDAPEMIEKDSHDSSREEDALVVSKSPDMVAVKNISSTKASDTDAASIASSSQSESLHEDDHPKKTGKKRSVQEETPSLDFTSKKASKAARESDAKLGRSVKKAPLKKNEKISIAVDTSKNESEGVSNSEKKQMKQLGKSVESKRSRKIKPTQAAKTSAEDGLRKTLSTKSSSKSSIDASSPEETPRISSKRKRPASQQKATEKNLDATLVGSKVKVWWPDDKQFYEGVVHSYYPVSKKHKIFYDDGDIETLLLNKERWKIIDDSSEGQDAETTSPDATSGLRKRAKAKLNPKPLVKPGKSDVSLKSGAASSSKAKGATTKYGSLSKGKSKVDSPKTSSKSKQDGGKSKPDSAKTGVKSKTKTHQAGDDGNAGKMGNKGKVADVAKGGKGKSKVQEVEGSAKKRRRVG